MLRLRITVMVLIGLILVFPSVGIFGDESVTLKSWNNQVEMNLTILNAYYTDADGDGSEDDVIAEFVITLSGSNRYNFIIFPTLTLPSGMEHSYGYFINTRLSILHCTMYFYHSATESGWYTFSIEIIGLTGGGASGLASFEFDPPGGSGDADPCGKIVVF